MRKVYFEPFTDHPASCSTGGTGCAPWPQPAWSGRRWVYILHRMPKRGPGPLVGVIMGSKSDLKYMTSAAELLTLFEIPHEMQIVSAHRTPDWMFEYAATAEGRGLE